MSPGASSPRTALFLSGAISFGCLHPGRKVLGPATSVYDQMLIVDNLAPHRVHLVHDPADKHHPVTFSPTNTLR